VENAGLENAGPVSHREFN